MGGWIRGALDLQIWGAPFLPPICGKMLVLKGFGGNLRQKWGAPNLQIQRPTDPTPHLKPSDLKFGHRPKFAQKKKSFFHREALQGGPR